MCQLRCATEQKSAMCQPCMLSHDLICQQAYQCTPLPPYLQEGDFLVCEGGRPINHGVQAVALRVPDVQLVVLQCSSVGPAGVCGTRKQILGYCSH